MAKTKTINKNITVRVDLSVPSIDDSISMAKDFIDALVIPALAETGLLIKDYITGWRLKNQVKIINRSKEICEQHGINPKTISLKLLAPLLDNAGLEEEDYLQEKWAYLLANMVDSKQNVDNHVFPYLLSQISKGEYNFIQNEFDKRNQSINSINEELGENLKQQNSKITELKKNKLLIKKSVETLKTQDNVDDHTLWLKQQEIRNIETSIWQCENNSAKVALRNKLIAINYISVGRMQEYEIANLVRLGILKLTQKPYTKEKQIELPERGDSMWLDLEIELDIEDYSFTELGEKFILACSDANL